jgi:hypothetical protein
MGEKRVTKANGDIEVTEIDMVERAKLQIHARQWSLARMNRKKYGDKTTQEIVGADGGAVVHKIEFEIVDPSSPGSEEA